MPYGIRAFIRLPLRLMHAPYQFVNVLADNKVTVITRWPLCPLAADCQSVWGCVCVCAVSMVVYNHFSAPCSWCMYRPDSGMEKCLPSTQNQWLLFSPLHWPPVICKEYKAHIVAHRPLALIYLIFMFSAFFTIMTGITGYWAKTQDFLVFLLKSSLPIIF